MYFLVLHNYRKFKTLLLENFLQIFFTIALGILMLVLSALQFKSMLQPLLFSNYAIMVISGFLIASHVLAILLIKKNKDDLYFQEYVRKSSFFSFVFRWRREIGILFVTTLLLSSLFVITFVVIEHYMYIVWLLLLVLGLFILSLFFLIQVTLKNSIKKLLIFLLYYAFIVVKFIVYNDLLAIVLAVLFVIISLCTYKELDYIQPLYKKINIKMRKERTIKDYADFIITYIMREQVYLELAVFSLMMTAIPLLFNVFQIGHLLLENIGLISLLWDLLIIEMCALLAVGFSELIKLHRYFFLKNNFNKYYFIFLYLSISFVISSFFIIIPGLSVFYYMKLQILDIPFSFFEIIAIILLGMYISLFFPSTRKKTPVLAFATITILWMIIKQVIVSRVGDTSSLLILIFLLLYSLVYIAIVIEISSLNKGVVITNDN